MYPCAEGIRGSLLLANLIRYLNSCHISAGRYFVAKCDNVVIDAMATKYVASPHSCSSCCTCSSASFIFSCLCYKGGCRPFSGEFLVFTKIHPVVVLELVLGFIG